jgi:hypothetical protein
LGNKNKGPIDWTSGKSKGPTNLRHSNKLAQSLALVSTSHEGKSTGGG